MKTHNKTRCQKCKLLFWRKHKCRMEKVNGCGMIGTQGMIQFRCGELGRLCPKCYNQERKREVKS